jgi:ankyrin repeat protein
MLGGAVKMRSMKRACLFWVVAAVAAAPAFGVDEEPSRRLVAAVARGDAAQVAALVRRGADPDAADRSGWTALHLAAEKGDTSLARLLLDAGARPDLRSRARGTPLDVAERAGRGDVARLLRLHGARGSGKSIGDTVCVRPWGGDGYCGVVEAADPTRYRLRVSRVVGCAGGCAPDPSCSAGQPVGAGGLGEGDVLWVPASCLTHTGVR